jgi:hypothetical protein
VGASGAESVRISLLGPAAWQTSSLVWIPGDSRYSHEIPSSYFQPQDGSLGNQNEESGSGNADVVVVVVDDDDDDDDDDALGWPACRALARSIHVDDAAAKINTATFSKVLVVVPMEKEAQALWFVLVGVWGKRGVWKQNREALCNLGES